MTRLKFLLALDQGTSSSRSIVFNAQGEIVAKAQREFRQIFPQPGRVEHDPNEIWSSQIATAQEALAQAGIGAADLASIGITNQRETTLVWNRATGEPLYNAIVWQDRRGESVCANLRKDGLEMTIRQKTGLIIDSYFSATKLKWIFDTIPGARSAARKGELAFGTVDSWLVWRLTGGAVHATDVSNASRTMLFNVHSNQWDDDLLELFDVPREVLPAVHPSSHLYGNTQAELLGVPVAIGGIAGDQQAALFGQACFRSGMVKNTYGTGCFMLMHTGTHFHTSTNGLVTTSAAQLTSAPEFALEGSVFIGGAVVQWLRDGLGAIKQSNDIERLAESVPDSGGVMFVPAFTGLGAPYWKPDARGAIVGLTRGTTVAHIARAALESIAFQNAALVLAMCRDAAAATSLSGDRLPSRGGVEELRVDGGACVNNLLMQFQADLLGIPVVRPKVIETTALGAAYLAGLSSGVYRGLDELAAHWRVERTFYPTMSRDRAAELMRGWEHSVAQASL